jgi:hypothetical protein
MAHLNDPAGAKISPGRGGDANGIHPVMRVETAIFYREQRIDHVVRYAIEWNSDALFDEKGEGWPVVPVVDDGRLWARREIRQDLCAIELIDDGPGKENGLYADVPRGDRHREHCRQHHASSYPHTRVVDGATGVPRTEELWRRLTAHILPIS